MATPVTTAESFQFGGRPLNGVLLAWDAEGGVRHADFEYIKRNGAETEPQGAKQKRFNFRCTMLGSDLSNRLRDLISALEAQPRDVLTHPRLGAIKACFDTWHASEDASQAIDLIEFTLSFVEDGADQSLIIAATPGPSQRAGQLSVSTETLVSTAAVKYNVASVPALAKVYSAVLSYQTLANSFTVAALQAAQSTVYDPGLQQRRDLLAGQRDLVLTALTASLLYTLDTDLSLTPFRSATWQVWASALDLYEAVLRQRPALVPFVVPSAMSLAAVSLRLYGKDARAKMDELRLLNPHLPNAAFLAGGTVLQVTAPQVRQ